MTDQDILKKIKDPAQRNYGFNLLIEKYHQRLYWHIRRIVIDHDDSDDLLQEVFIKAHQKIENFREESQLYTWLYRIATNLCLNHLKAKRRRYFLPIQDVKEELVSSLDNSILVTGDEIQKKLQKAILQLPDKQRAVFNMKYYDEMKYEEISEITGTSVGALKASYHHAVKKIEEYLSGD